MLKKYNKLDSRVQLMRIIACLLVIACHIRIDAVSGDSYNPFSLFLSCFSDDGVAIFFAMMGFFILVRDDDSESVIWYEAKAFVRVLVPVLFFMLVYYALCPALYGNSAEFMMIIKSFLSQNWALDLNLGHLWYIGAYLQLIIMMPLIRLLTLNHPYAVKARNWILFINILAMFAGDIKAALPGTMRYVTPYEIVGRSFTYVVLGYSIYQAKDAVLKHKSLYRCGSVFALIIVNVIRFLLQSHLFKSDLSNIYYYTWATGISLIVTASFVVFFLSFEKKDNTKICKVINFIGSTTFFIYIVHRPVYSFFSLKGIDAGMYMHSIDASMSNGAILIYELTYPAVIFLVSFILVAIPSLLFDIFMEKAFAGKK